MHDNEGDCGVQQIQPVLDPEERIVGGAKAVPGSWPWHAQLRVVRDYCSGVLISDRHVLTAAHCAEQLRPRILRVHLGAHLRSAPVEGQVYLHVKEICVHPGYNGRLPTNMVPDIAIIELVEKVNMTTTIQPVCLPKSGEELPEGSKLYATGWGGVEVHKADGKWTVHGIVSTGPTPCNSPSSPQGFVKVSAYIKDFIEPYMDPSNGPEERGKLCQYFS
ncbi:hypothetical protein HPB47_017725 [Ixodes persulcatus]|uniref:Uncharacterized protein n=1 Tax=Ixodes persulcatus TaxID=34615 RepID=A0AC60QMK3_IXOPE|nr:hypothetical protein HPB47_017725 [Ixodes persulcatus]